MNPPTILRPARRQLKTSISVSQLCFQRILSIIKAEHTLKIPTVKLKIDFKKCSSPASGLFHDSCPIYTMQSDLLMYDSTMVAFRVFFFCSISNTTVTWNNKEQNFTGCLSFQRHLPTFTHNYSLRINKQLQAKKAGTVLLKQSVTITGICRASQENFDK